MIAEISAAVAAVQAVNSAISSVKESAGHAGDLSAVIGRWADATEKAQAAEKKGAGVMSYKEALQMESVTRQLANFDRQLQDICLLQGQGDLYRSIKQRMEESRLAHEKEVAKLRAKRKEFQKTMKLLGTILFSGISFMGILLGALYLYVRMK
jgi:hypothetical protein